MWRFRPLLRAGRFDLVRRHRLFGPHFPCRLVLSQSFERGLSDHAIAGPAGKFDLCHKIWLDPRDVLRPPRRTFAAKGALIG
jgi:hypothetical protein